MAAPSATQPDTLYELMRVLREMEKHITEMARLEDLKRIAIVDRALQPLSDISLEQEILSVTLRNLEEDRLQIVRRMYPGRAQPSLQQLADAIDEPEATELRVLAQGLGDAIYKLRGLAATNGALLTRGAELARIAAQWLLGFMHMAPAYNRSGELEDQNQLSIRGWTA